MLVVVLMYLALLHFHFHFHLHLHFHFHFHQAPLSEGPDFGAEPLTNIFLCFVIILLFLRGSCFCGLFFKRNVYKRRNRKTIISSISIIFKSDTSFIISSIIMLHSVYKFFQKTRNMQSLTTISSVFLKKLPLFEQSDVTISLSLCVISVLELYRSQNF